MDEFLEMEFEDRINGGIDDVEDYEVFPAYDDEFWDDMEKSDVNWMMARYDIENDIENDYEDFDDFEYDYE